MTEKDGAESIMYLHSFTQIHKYLYNYNYNHCFALQKLRWKKKKKSFNKTCSEVQHPSKVKKLWHGASTSTSNSPTFNVKVSLHVCLPHAGPAISRCKFSVRSPVSACVRHHFVCVCVCLSCVSAANAPGYVSSDLFLFMYFPFLNSRPGEHAGGYTDTEEWEAHFIYFLSRVITQHKYPCRQKDGTVRTPKAWEMEVLDSSSGQNIIANSLYWLWCKDIKFLG